METSLPLGSDPLALPRLSSLTYTLAYRSCLCDCGRVGISPVKFTNHFPEANPPNTLTLDRRLTVFAADRRSPRWRSPCFTKSRKLALRLGRNVNPPQVLFPGSFVATFTVTLASYLHNEVRETSSEQARTRSGRLRPPH